MHIKKLHRPLILKILSMKDGGTDTALCFRYLSLTHYR